MNSILKCIRNLSHALLYKRHHRKHESFYHNVMELNGIQDVPVEGEKDWLVKWSQFGVKASPTQYRVFSHYIGNDRDIVPEDICHDFIEPLLNPLDFTGYYSDKNIFDKLFPKDYLPLTILRRMNGFWYDDKYRKVSLTDSMLRKMLDQSAASKIIIKPSVDGMSGKGVRMFECSGGGVFLRSGRVDN